MPVKPDDMREIYEMLAALEPETAAGLAAQKPTAEQLSSLEEATAEMEVALNNQVHRSKIATLRLREKPVESTEEHRETLKIANRKYWRRAVHVEHIEKELLAN